MVPISLEKNLKIMEDDKNSSKFQIEKIEEELNDDFLRIESQIKLDREKNKEKFQEFKDIFMKIERITGCRLLHREESGGDTEIEESDITEISEGGGNFNESKDLFQF